MNGALSIKKLFVWASIAMQERRRLMNVGRWYNWSSYIFFFYFKPVSQNMNVQIVGDIWKRFSLSNMSVDEPFKEWIYNVPQKNVDFKEGKKV